MRWMAITLAVGSSLSAGIPVQAADCAHYRIRAVVDPAAHTIAVDGTFRDPAGRETPIHQKKAIDHPISREGEDYARGFAETEGTILDEGVFLSGASGWYPRFGDGPFTFELDVALPAGWEAMSQGRREVLDRGDAGSRLRFVAMEPQEEVWLVAGRWVETKRMFEGTEGLALLRDRDDALAARYLDATGPYLSMYSTLLGPYPYSKFALVENFWETGYGMPSFTLLGSKVIRLPFILTSSYPHEILHNWWGNGVYVATDGGNWSEGLTAYLAEHLFAERAGTGAAYRQETLQKYADYASKSKDFPLSRFRERHSPATEAVGYGKALMLFHMIRRELGDAAFVKGLREFFSRQKFHRARFDDIRRALETVSGRDLQDAFTPWVTRTGAPRLKVRDVTAIPGNGGSWRLAGTIEQLQSGAPYALSVPLAVTLEGSSIALQSVIRADKHVTAFELTASSRPLRLDLDPEFDLFRMLDVEEAPPALSSAFGAEASTLILPARAEAPLLAAYRAMATTWNTGRTPPMKVVVDADLAELPKDGSLWIVGYENRYYGQAVDALRSHAASPERIGDHAVALVSRRRKGRPSVLAFVAAARAIQVPGLARKLPHYHKYSHLAFDGDEPVNVEKGRWPILDSPLSAVLSGDAPMAALSPRPALAALPEAFSKDRMLRVVRALAAPEMKGRGQGTPELDRAASLIGAELKQSGLEVLPADPEMNNVTGVLRGTKSEWTDQSVVVGAHYDHLGTSEDGTAHPGADDNASGVAVLLELARQMAAGGRPSRTIVFVAFTGEESGLTGSKRYASSTSPWPAGKAIGMVNLDTVGRLFRGKILVLGSNSADEWIHIVNGAGYVTGAPVEAVMNDPGGSDQKSFVDIGVPAVQLFTGAHPDYHAPGDTADKIDGDGLVKVAAIARELVAYLAERPTPLTSRLTGATGLSATPESAGRRVSLGTIPDYAFPGPGVRITGTMPGSPAQKAGLQSGDILIRIGEIALATMREFGDTLKTFAPGTKVSVTYQRAGVTRTVEAVLVAR